MEIINTFINDLYVLKPKIFKDNRGYFYESFNLKDLKKKIKIDKIFQENISFSKKNVIRGLHFQTSPKAQDKLIKVLEGKILDVAVDLRKKSKTYKKWFAIELSEKNKKMLWIPKGFAHGFLTLSKTAKISYLVTNSYSKKHEKCILWNDKYINIKWGRNIKPKLSNKDLDGESSENF